MQRTAIIMAGGSGERFWPLSRKHRPKQLLRLTRSDKTMLQEAIDRIAPVIPAQDIFVITSETLQQAIRAEIHGLPPENVVAEPHKRNTAGCIALGAAFIAERYAAQGIAPENISIAVLTADHRIVNETLFCDTVRAALRHAEQSGGLVTLGVQPTEAATGYGYIEYEQSAAAAEGAFPVHPVRRFCEKPDRAKAESFLAAGNFLWNSGMFFWRNDAVSAGLAEQLPEVGGSIPELRRALHGKTTTAYTGAVPGIAELFGAFPDISIDYGLMERARNVAVIRATFEWDDVGALDALSRTRENDDAGNVLEGNTVVLDSRNSIIINNADGKALTVAAIGLDGMAVVATEDAILVCPRERVQDVKRAVAVLRERDDNRFL